MNKLITVAIFSSLAIMFSCTTPGGEKAKLAQADTIVANTEGADKYDIDASQSKIEWIGYKPTGQHNGTLALKSGSLFLVDDTPVGGEFVIDMNSLKVLDLEDPEWNGKLTGHLRSPDFFDVDKNPEAKFVVTRIVRNKAGGPAYLLTGNLTIKGITKSVSFGTDIAKEGDSVSGTAPQFTIDRTEYDIKYKSNKFFSDLQNEFINDEFALTISLKGKKASS
ncbi:MAG TPA: YceI family protein [Bacteroidales bacterium]|nr:YceI family protein [Bacteroidales bacterium]